MATKNSVMAVIVTARPSFRNKHDKIAFAIHAFFASSGYTLTATGEFPPSNAVLSSSFTDEASIKDWNTLDDKYCFVYATPEKNEKVSVKCLKLGDKLVVDALAAGSGQPAHLEINVDDYVVEDVRNNFSEQYQNMEDFVKILDDNILSKLNGPSKASSSSSCYRSGKDDVARTNLHVSDDQLHEPWGSQHGDFGIVYPPVVPIGHNDLFPGAGAGMYPVRSDFCHGGGSMLLGPDDPMWAQRFRPDQHRFPGELGIPSGARFDPFGPPGVPGFEPSRFVRNPRRQGAETHPDLQHFGGGGSGFI